MQVRPCAVPVPCAAFRQDELDLAVGPRASMLRTIAGAGVCVVSKYRNVGCGEHGEVAPVYKSWNVLYQGNSTLCSVEV